jgi:hypothetical protein
MFICGFMSGKVRFKKAGRKWEFSASAISGRWAGG